MSNEGLELFIILYISARLQAKLDAFDKAAEKQCAALEGEELAEVKRLLIQERQEIEQRHEVRAWLTDAASRAGQISLVTHALKFTHSDAKGSSVFSTEYQAAPTILSTATLRQPAIDAVGNAAALDVAKLLQTEHHGDSLVAALQRGDERALQTLAQSPEQLAQWVAGFRQVFSDQQPSSHKLAKQIYFPVGEGAYHLLSPLYSSSLSHALYARISAVKFGEEMKTIRAAQKEKRWHDHPYVNYPHLALQNMGGTKPQNISALNSARRGRSYLLHCAPPQWRAVAQPPLQHASIFRAQGEADYHTYAVRGNLKHFLLRVNALENTRDIRRQRMQFVDQIIDQLFFYVASVQELQPAGWSAHSQLVRSQQLWLDPLRCASDVLFQREREAGDWQQEVAHDFGRWLNRGLRHDKLNVGETERREWSNAALFKQRMREMENALKGEWA